MTSWLIIKSEGETIQLSASGKHKAQNLLFLPSLREHIRAYLFPLFHFPSSLVKLKIFDSIYVQFHWTVISINFTTLQIVAGHTNIF